MAWETTGTVTVTNDSATVTGSGTLFTVKSRVGDAFIGPDGALYEIINIVSNTTLSISPKYLGTTGSGLNYRIAPIRGYQKLSADRLYELINTVGDSVSIATNLPQWLKIGSPAPVTQGGTGGETADEARTNLDVPSKGEVVSGRTAWFEGLSGAAGKAVLSKDTVGEIRAELELKDSATKASTSELGTSPNLLATQLALHTATASLGAATVSYFSWNRRTDTKVSGVFNATESVQANMRRCLLLDDGTVNYYLDPTDSNKRENGSPSVLTGADGQVMVEIPQTFVKVSVVGDIVTWSTSPTPMPGFVLHPAFLEGGELYFDEQLGFSYYKNYTSVKKFIYYSAYFANVQSGSTYINGLNLDDNSSRVNTASDKLASVNNSYPMVGLIRSQLRDLATNRGTGWQLTDFWTNALLQVLFVTEYHTLNTQSVLGAGNTAGSYLDSSSSQSDSPHTRAGKSNALGNKSGYLNGAGQVAWMSYRGIENWYGQAYQPLDGVNFNEREVYVSNNPAEFSDSLTNHTKIGVTLPESGYFRQVQENALSFLPTSTSGASSNIAYSDYVYSNTGLRVGWFGGNASSGARAGGFVLNATHAGGRRDRTRSARFIFKKK